MNHDQAKLNEAVSLAMEATQQYRQTFSNHPDGRKTDTTDNILNALKGGLLSRLQIRGKLTDLTGTQLQNALDRLRKANKIEKVGHGLYGVKDRHHEPIARDVLEEAREYLQQRGITQPWEDDPDSCYTPSGSHHHGRRQPHQANT